MVFRKLTFAFLIIFLTITCSTTVSSDDIVELEEIEKDYQKVLEAKRIKLERHRGFVQKWHERGYLQELISVYESDIEKGRESADVYYGLGYAYFVKAETDDDEEALDKAVKNFSEAVVLKPSSFLVHLSLAEAYKRQNEYEKSIEHYVACLELNREYYRAYYEIGELYRRQGKYEQALDAYREVGKLKTDWAPPFYSMGLIYLQRDEIKKAEVAFRHVIKVKSNHPLAHFKLGQVYAKEGKVAEALREYDEGEKYYQPNADIFYRLGKIFQETNEITYAQIQYQKAIKVEPNHVPSHFQLGEIYYRKDEKEKALQHYQTAIKLNPELEGYFLRQFDKVRDTATINEARTLLDKSLLINPNSVMVHFKYAKLESELGNSLEAIRHFEKTIEIDENFVEAYVPFGNLYYETNQREKAAQTYRQAFQLQPELKNMFFNRAKEAFSQGDFSGAIENFDKHSLIYPQDATTQYWLGRCYDKLEDYDKSLEYYLKAVELKPDYEEAFIEIAQNYQRRGETKKMMDVLDRLVKVNPEYAYAHYLLAHGYLKMNQPDKAIDEFTKVIELEPDNLDAHYQLGMLYEKKEKTDSAVFHYERAIEIEPEFAKPYFRVGKIYLNRGDKDNVVRVYSKGLFLEPEHPQVQYDLASIYEERGEILKATEHFGLANKFNPDRYDWHYRYARLLDQYARSLNEDYEKYASMAVEEYTKTIKLNYAYAPAFYYRGLFTRKYKQIGDKFYSFSMIAEDFKQAIELAPEMIDAYYQLGLTYLDMDDYSKAEDIFKKALKVDPNYKGLNLQLGLIAQWRKEYDQAIEYYKAELENNPESVEAYQQLGYLYSNYTMELNKAKDILEKALELEPNDVSTLLNYGNTLYNMGEVGSAIEKFELAVQLEPKNLTANYNLALMYERVDKPQLAISRWKKFLELNIPEQWRREAQKHLNQLQSE